MRSDQYAEKMNVEKYDYVLHPRTTGFTHFVQEMKKGTTVRYQGAVRYPGLLDIRGVVRYQGALLRLLIQ